MEFLIGDIIVLRSSSKEGHIVTIRTIPDILSGMTESEGSSFLNKIREQKFDVSRYCEVLVSIDNQLTWHNNMEIECPLKSDSRN